MQEVKQEGFGVRWVISTLLYTLFVRVLPSPQPVYGSEAFDARQKQPSHTHTEDKPRTAEIFYGVAMLL